MPAQLVGCTFLQGVTQLHSHGGGCGGLGCGGYSSFGRPTEQSCVDSLPTIVIGEEGGVPAGEHECAVCKDELEEAACCRRLPCNHLYHNDCILPWLATVRSPPSPQR